MSRSKFEISLDEGPHAFLSKLEGRWTGTCKTWFEKGVLAEEQLITLEAHTMLDGRFIKIIYKSMLQDKPLEGEMTLGFDLANQTWQCAWVDSFHMHTGIMLSEGQATAGGCYLNGSYGSLDWPDKWGWDTEFRLSQEGELILTAFNVPPGGEPEKATKSILRRQH